MDKLLQRLRKFSEERDWDQFHSPRNLAISLVLEAGEVLEKFQWKKDGEGLTKGELLEFNEELADVFNYLLMLAEKLEVDLIKVANKKIDKNALKYPVEESKGKATKYTKL